MMFFRSIAAVIIMSLAFTSFAEYKYELVEQNGHRVHVTTLDPAEYYISFVSAHNQVFGRERVGDIAERENAQIAINAGFFQIADIEDGRPTGTALNDAEIFGIRTTKHGCLVKKEGKLAIEIITPSLEVIVNSNTIKPLRFNRFAKGRNIFYFNRAWGPTTLSSYNARKEVIFGANMQVVDVMEHGNNKIPEGGYVLSFPKNTDLSYIKIGAQANFNWTPDYFAKDNSFAVMGLPTLILDNKVQENLSNDQKHARTAVGIKEDESVVLVVVEHAYKKDIHDITLQEVKGIMENKKISFSDINASEIKKIIFEDLTSDDQATGMGILDLAEFMHSIGCSSAINLDGGGSSSLYISGKYINTAIGDADEGAGQKIFRPVSDALVFRKK
ncbi:MAG: phosphodiester glycosidase family protein [Rickettsiaceae bacterium]|nr:phosphodiester glycosidase family protein [Rickettsiaceae bacterium]